MTGRHPSGSRANRRVETGADEDFLAALFRATHRSCLGGLDPALADVLLRQQFGGQREAYRAAHPGARFDIVEVGGEPVGRLVTAAAESALRIVDVALLPHWQGRGIGTGLLRALQSEADAAGVPLRLSVARTNARARRLYARLGFRPVEATETHLGLEWAP